MERVDVHAQHTIGAARVQPFGVRALARCAKRDVQRQQVFLGRMVLGRVRRLPPVVEQIGDLARTQRGVNPIGKAVDPGRRRIVQGMAAEFRQVMREASAADNQHALVAERRQRAADTQMMLGSQMRLHRQLQNRNVGLRIHHE